MGHVHKIRSPRYWSHKKWFTRKPATLACSLAPPSNSKNTEPAAILSLDWAPFAMELPHASPARCELHAVIHFLSAKGTTPVDIHRQLCEVYGPQCMDIKNMQKWVREFMYRCIDIHDEQRCGQPLVSAETIAKVEQEMLEDRRVIVWWWVDQWQGAKQGRALPAQCGRRVLWQGYMKKCHSACKIVSIATVIMSKNSWKVQPFDQCKIHCQ